MLPIGTTIRVAVSPKGVRTMTEFETGSGHQGASGMSFPDILADPLVRAVMVADHVDPDALRADLVRIAWLPGGSDRFSSRRDEPPGQFFHTKDSAHERSIQPVSAAACPR